MKNLKYLLGGAICLLFTSVTMTSCLDDDDEDYSLTQEQYTQYLNTMAGTYRGKMYFWNDTITLTEKKRSKMDSLLNVSVGVRGVNDSIISVIMPAKYLGKNIKNTAENKALKDAIDAAPNQTIRAKFYMYQLQNSTVYFGVYPTPNTTTLNLNYGGADHKVDISWLYAYNYYGAYANRYMEISLYMTGIKVDNTSVWTASNSSSAANSDEYYNPTYTFSLSKQY